MHDQFRTRGLRWLAAALLCTASLAPQAATQQELIRALDELDREEMLDALADARSCIYRRQFDCAEKQLKKARKVANTSADRREVKSVETELTREVAAKEAEDAREREERRRAERERERVEEIERQERLAERRRQQEEEDEAREASRRDVLNHFQNKMNEIAAFQRNMNQQAQLTAQLVAQAQAQKQAEANARAAERQRQVDEQRERQAAQQRVAQANAERQDAERRREAERLERERKAEEARRQREEERRRAEEERRVANERRAEEQRKREAEALARKQAEEQRIADEKRKEQETLELLRYGIRLGAANCYGETHVGGKLPKGVKKDLCINVRFTAYCPGDGVGTKGEAKNFIGFDVGCFGDTTRIPTPACKAKELRVEVDEVVKC